MASPTPDPRSLREVRREREGTIRTLPQERQGAVPTWPLSRASARELAVWTEVWALPEAVIWEESKSFRQVGMYVRTSVEAEARGATAAVRSLLLRQETNLLLVESALLKAGYRISAFSQPERSRGGATSSRPVVDVRDRWQQDRVRALRGIPTRGPGCVRRWETMMHDRDALIVLPRTYRGPVPAWPLPNQTDDERAAWVELWSSPQASVWAEYRLEYQVGRYVRTLLRSRAPGATKAMGKVAHSMAVSLLLTPTSLRRAGYRISPVEAVERPAGE